MNQDYQLIDSGDFEKLEKVGPLTLSRPSPQAVWPKGRGSELWSKADAQFSRFSGGDGKWTIKNKKMPKSWPVKVGAITFKAMLTDFGHIGIFPEQLENWKKLQDLCHEASNQCTKEFRVLNLFAYTGGATLAAAAGGAQVVHLDASKASVVWARENAEASRLATYPIRWVTDDVQKFVARERRRGSKYHGIILDPPSYGRGAQGQTWKIEEHLCPLIANLKNLFAEDARFVLLTSHSPGYSPLVLRNLLRPLQRSRSDQLFPVEMLLPAANPEILPLPSGASCFLYFG